MKTYAITSGKGGVGKTNISANLGIALSRLRQRVVVFDADIGLANLDVVFGCPISGTLQDVISGVKTLPQVVHFGPEGVRFIPGGSGAESLFSLNHQQSERFLSELQTLSFNSDVLIFDTGAGIDSNVLGFLKAADEVLLVVTPDPSSLTDGYATVKSYLADNGTAPIGVIVNMVDSEAEAKAVYDHLSSVVERFLKGHLTFAGYVRNDSQASAYIRRRVPFSVGNPNSPASNDIARIAAALLGQKAAPQSQDLVTKLKSMFSFGQRRTA
ncbi:MAG TPA: MinD/ParA family protein [Fimbriimonas sp.]|nr:MinD/ParA family protein [Fimbriimonas sp.]